MTHDVPNVWLDDERNPMFPSPNHNGDLTLTVDLARHQRIRLVSSENVDCRFGGNQWVRAHNGMQVSYSLKEIISQGIVSVNQCGEARVDPTPGVLVLYVRPLTFAEKWQL